MNIAVSLLNTSAWPPDRKRNKNSYPYTSLHKTFLVPDHGIDVTPLAPCPARNTLPDPIQLNMHKVRIQAANYPGESSQRLLILFSLVEFIGLTLHYHQPRLNSDSDPDHIWMVQPRSCYEDEAHAAARHFVPDCSTRPQPGRRSSRHAHGGLPCR